MLAHNYFWQTTAQHPRSSRHTWTVLERLGKGKKGKELRTLYLPSPLSYIFFTSILKREICYFFSFLTLFTKMHLAIASQWEGPFHAHLVGLANQFYFLRKKTCWNAEAIVFPIYFCATNLRRVALAVHRRKWELSLLSEPYRKLLFELVT